MWFAYSRVDDVYFSSELLDLEPSPDELKALSTLNEAEKTKRFTGFEGLVAVSLSARA